MSLGINEFTRVEFYNQKNMTNQERFDKLFVDYRNTEHRQTERKKKLNLLKSKILAGYGSQIEKEERCDEMLLKS